MDADGKNPQQRAMRRRWNCSKNLTDPDERATTADKKISVRKAGKIAETVENFDRAKEIFEKASRLRPDQAFADQLLLDHLARELLIDMGRKYAPVRSVAFSNILDFVKEHYAENISLSTLSESFDLSPSYIARLFKRELNKRPSVYINGLRISAAKASGLLR